MTARIGLILGADAGQFEREMNKAAQATAKVDRIMEAAGNRKFLNTKEAQAYDRAVKDVDKSLKYLVDDYRRITGEVERLNKAQQAQAATGRAISAAQKEELATLKAIQHARAQAIESQKRDFASAQQSRQGSDGRPQSFGGGFAQGFGGTMFPRGAALMNAYRQNGFRGMGAPMGSMLANGILGGVNWVQGQMAAGYQTLLSNQLAQVQLRQMMGVGRGINPVMGALGRLGLNMGFSRAETLNQAQSYAQQAGSLSGFGSSLQLQRALTISPNVLASLQGAGRAAGSRDDMNQVNLALVGALKVGGFQRALATELAQATTGLLGTMAGQSASISARQTMALVSHMSRALGGSYARNPAATGRLLGQLNQGIMAPGGGEAGQAFILRAMGLGTEKGVGYADAVARQEQLPLADRISRVLGRVQKEFGGVGAKDQAMLLKNLFGLKMDAAQRLIGMGSLDPSAISASLDGASPTDAKGLAAPASKGLGLLKRELYTQEAQATARAKADRMYQLANDVQVGVLQKLSGVLERLSSLVDRALSYLPSWMGGRAAKPQDRTSKKGMPK